MNKKKYFLLLIVLLIIILLFVALINYKTNFIQKISNNFYKEEETFTDGISFVPYSNTEEYVKTLVTIKRIDGIDNIEYLTEHGKIMKLYCNKKQEVSIDFETSIDKEYQFKVNCNGLETVETMRLDSNYINDYIAITKFDNETEFKYNQLNIEFNTTKDTSKKYYKIGEGPWREYSSTIQLDLADIPINDLNNNNYETTVYAKIVNENGNELHTNKTVTITKNDQLYEKFDVFENIRVSTNNILTYGMSYSIINSKSSVSLAPGKMGSGHWHNEGGHSVIFTLPLNIYKDISVSSIYVAFRIENTYWNKSYGSIIINYTDGTSSTTQINEKNVTATVNIDKDVENIQFKTWGSDGGTRRNSCICNRYTIYWDRYTKYLNIIY